MERHNAYDLHLAAPRLSRALPAWFDHAGLIPVTPALERLLERADRLGSPLATAALEAPLAFFGLTLREGTQPPWAALALAGEANGQQAGCWLRIDPVHLRPDMAQLLLFAPPDFSLTGAEATALAATVSSCLEEWGELTMPHPTRWYLKLKDSTPLATVPVERVAGRDTQGRLPEGEAGRAWRTRINEIQMLLFEHPVNQQREQQGLPAINSIWPWGWGQTPRVAEPRYRSVSAAAPIVRGLARLGGVSAVVDSESLDDWLAQGLPAGEHLIWLDLDNARAARDPEVWGAWLESLELKWFAGLADLLQRNRLRSLVLHSGDGQAWRMTRRALRRFWRRSRPLPSRLRLEVEA